jgi:DNA mismatch endonuclease (patch repair protein)
MADVLTPEQRRLNMSRIRGGNTKPEKLLRSALHVEGLRFRIHRRDLPGCPDIVFSRARLAVFVDGCFWHGCPEHAVKPKTNAEFWADKLRRNKLRDRKVARVLKQQGWNVVRFWEHEVERDIAGAVRTIAQRLVGRDQSV